MLHKIITDYISVYSFFLQKGSIFEEKDLAFVPLVYICTQKLSHKHKKTKTWITSTENNASIGAFYDIIMWWIHINIYSDSKFNKQKLAKVREKNISGNEIVSYEGPRASAGIHRVAFVLFKQEVRQTVDAPGWRQNFNTRDFSAFYNLGPPVAALYFNCQREGGVGGRRYTLETISRTN